jgi:ankyrin repeat protein
MSGATSAPGSAADRAEALVRSACSSDVGPARALLAADPTLASHDLACACACGETDEIARLLAASPAAASAQGPPLGREPILYACFSRLLRTEPDRAAGIREVVRLLLAAGADPNASYLHEDWLQVPLYGAAGIANDVELTRMLLAAGADPNDGDEAHFVGEILYHACEFPDPTCARLVIEAGADREVVDYCLGRAINFPEPAMTLMFCEHGAKPSAALLRIAVWRRRPEETIRALLDAGAPVDVKGSTGQTALRRATHWNDAGVMALLIERGADPASVTSHDRALGSVIAGGAGRLEDPDGLDELLDWAVHSGDLEVARRLLDAGAPLDSGPSAEGPPLGQAAWRGHPAVVRELVERGAKIAFEDGGSALGATLHGSRNCQHPEGGPTMQTVQEIPQQPYAEIVGMLLEAGAPVPSDPIDGLDPVRVIAELGIELG